MNLKLVANPVFCTVVTLSHFHQAITLAQSLRAFHPQSVLIVLLAENIKDATKTELSQRYASFGMQLITLDQLKADKAVIEKMTFYYTAFELCCSLRGLLHQYIWECTDAQQWIFLDTDTLALAPFDDVIEQLKSVTLLVTAHLSKPLEIENARGIERTVLAAGICNAGFLGVRRCDEAKKFIDWFCTRLERFGFNDHKRDVWFADQKWLNLALTAFNGVEFTKCKAINIGHWNFAHATFTHSQDGNYYYDGERLVLFHFSGWDINEPEKLSRFASAQQIPPASHQAWLDLSAAYAHKLQSSKTAIEHLHYSFANFANGRAITPWMRRFYYGLCESNKIPFSGSPFNQGKYFYRMQWKLNGLRGIRQRIKHWRKRGRAKAVCNWN